MCVNRKCKYSIDLAERQMLNCPLAPYGRWGEGAGQQHGSSSIELDLAEAHQLIPPMCSYDMTNRA